MSYLNNTRESVRASDSDGVREERRRVAEKEVIAGVGLRKKRRKNKRLSACAPHWLPYLP